MPFFTSFNGSDEQQQIRMIRIRFYCSCFIKPILFLILLPCCIIYIHLRIQLMNRSHLLLSENKLQYVVVIMTMMNSLSSNRTTTTSSTTTTTRINGMKQKQQQKNQIQLLGGIYEYYPCSLSSAKTQAALTRSSTISTTTSITKSNLMIEYIRIQPKLKNRRYNDDSFYWNFYYYSDMIGIANLISGESSRSGNMKKKNDDNYRSCSNDVTGNPYIYLSSVEKDVNMNQYCLRYYEEEDGVYCTGGSGNENNNTSVIGQYYYKKIDNKNKVEHINNINNEELDLSIRIMSLYDYYYYGLESTLSKTSSSINSINQHHRSLTMMRMDNNNNTTIMKNQFNSQSVRQLDDGWNNNVTHRTNNISSTIKNTNVWNDNNNNNNNHDDSIQEQQHRILNNNNRFHNIRKNTFWYNVIIKIPATTFIILLNVIIAFYYWNVRIQPEAVGKIYVNMMHGPLYEIWRCYTGSIAHFDVWHLSVNMMSLYSLGQEIEGNMLLSSLSFFLYNISLIPIVTTIWILFQYIEQNHHRYYTYQYYITLLRQGRTVADNVHTTTTNTNIIINYNHNIPTVGYSGILFVWMVIASLEQKESCPIFFLPSLCFQTYTIIYNIKFSLSPIIQLIILQIILPRISFTGHLSGIIIGFILYWGLLPLYYIQPCIIIPILYLLYLIYIRQIPIPSYHNYAIYFSNYHHHHNTTISDSESNTRSITRQVSHSILGAQLLTVLMSIYCFGLLSSLTISFIITIIFWYLTLWNHYYQENNDNNNNHHNVLSSSSSSSYSNNNNNSNHQSSTVMAKGFVVSAVLVIVTDSMNIGSWMILPPFTYPSFKMISFMIILFRSIILFISIIYLIINNLINNIRDEIVSGGIFENMFGYTLLQPFRTLVVSEQQQQITSWISTFKELNHNDCISNNNMERTTTTINNTSWTSFRGQGRVLGGGSNNNNNIGGNNPSYLTASSRRNGRDTSSII